MPSDSLRPAPDSDRLRGAAERFDASGALDRSLPLRRLFDFLLVSTLAGRMPREIDVAQDAFGRTSAFEAGQDATIRVHVHRLRRKLEEFRAAHPDEAYFLFIPRGEYRLALGEPAPAAPADDPEPGFASPHPARRFGTRWIWALALAALLSVNAAGWIVAVRRDARPAIVRTLERSPFWATIAGASGPTVIVLGDYYIVGEAPNATEVTRLVREFSINSREDLDEYLMAHPDQMDRLVDLDLHYLPVGAAPALGSLLPVIDGLHRHGRVRIITMSQLTPEIMRGSNLIYIGYLSGLGLLRNTVFEASSLAVGDSYDDLVDTKTGKRYSSDWAEVASGRTPRRDFGYLANMALPGGKRLLVIAGTRDAALMQTAESAIDAAQVSEIARRTRDALSTESLLEVSAMGNVALASRLVLSRPVPAGGRRSSPGSQHPQFPDEIAR